jgi:flavin reductase (DIM6/NTAB) family NADH-FMN oxidoreductase RutF
MADELAGELPIHPVCTPALSSMENSMDESFKLCRPVPIATAGNSDDEYIASMVSSSAGSVSIPPSSLKSCAPRRPLGRFLLIAAALTFAMPVVTSAQQLQMPNSDRCRAPDANKQSEGEHPNLPPRSDDNASKELSDCGGVLKPPTTGDSAMEKPAPKGGKMPVIPPSAVPGQQEQQTPEVK